MIIITSFSTVLSLFKPGCSVWRWNTLTLMSHCTCSYFCWEVQSPMCHLSNNLFRFSSKIASVGICHKLPLQLHKNKSLHFGWSLLGGLTILLCVLLTGNQGSMFILLFWERLSEKVHAAMPKGIVCSFEFNVWQVFPSTFLKNYSYMY